MVSRRSALRRKRYAEDPEYRERYCATRRRWWAAHKEEGNERKRRARYGISEADYQAMLARQGGVCAICRRKSKRRLEIDHCHKTGKVRGLLCGNCNTALGRCHDDPDILRAAIAYLEASRRDADELADRSMGGVRQGAWYGGAMNDGFAPATHRRARRKRSVVRGAGAPRRFQTARQAP
jgi:hypothetical protein